MMAPLRPSDIFVIQAAMKEYKRKHPGQATPSAEVALAWLAGRRGRRIKRPQQPKPAEAGLFIRILNNVRFLFKPLGSV
jgi:hypothetical protein